MTTTYAFVGIFITLIVGNFRMEYVIKAGEMRQFLFLCYNLVENLKIDKGTNQ